MATRDLQCPSGCREDRFEALNAPVYVDHSGRYLGHDATRATYVCATCQSVAIDVGAAAREMRRAGAGPLEALRCPACRSLMLPPDDDPLAEELECPLCGTRFTLDEGHDTVLGGTRVHPDDDHDDDDLG